jgi:hypothetical protein
MVVNLSFQDRSRYFSFKWLLIYSHKGRVYPVPDPLLLGKSGRSGNRTRGLWVSSQKIINLLITKLPLTLTRTSILGSDIVTAVLLMLVIM